MDSSLNKILQGEPHYITNENITVLKIPMVVRVLIVYTAQV